MSNISTNEKMATDDLFFSAVLIFIGIYASHINWDESDWLGLFGTALLTIVGVLWLVVRVYHLRHKADVFGGSENTDV